VKAKPKLLEFATIPNKTAREKTSSCKENEQTPAAVQGFSRILFFQRILVQKFRQMKETKFTARV
jgi:hypothetical protein